MRRQAALAEKNLGDFPTQTNGDEELYANRIGNFTKTMRHDAIGEVNPADYHLLLQALKSGNFHDWEAIPQGGTGCFLNPLGGLAFNIEGPDSPATTLVSVPFAIASAEKAAEMVELYGEAYLRDVPFTDNSTNPVIQEACDDLSSKSGYHGRGTPSLTRSRLPSSFGTTFMTR